MASRVELTWQTARRDKIKEPEVLRQLLMGPSSPYDPVVVNAKYQVSLSRYHSRSKAAPTALTSAASPSPDTVVGMSTIKSLQPNTISLSQERSEGLAKILMTKGSRLLRRQTAKSNGTSIPGECYTETLLGITHKSWESLTGAHGESKRNIRYSLDGQQHRYVPYILLDSLITAFQMTLGDHRSQGHITFSTLRTLMRIRGTSSRKLVIMRLCINSPQSVHAKNLEENSKVSKQRISISEILRCRASEMDHRLLHAGSLVVDLRPYHILYISTCPLFQKLIFLSCRILVRSRISRNPVPDLTNQGHPSLHLPESLQDTLCRTFLFVVLHPTPPQCRMNT